MLKFFSTDKKKSENEKTVATNSSTTGQGYMIHSSSQTAFTVEKQITTQRTETRTTTCVQQIGGNSPLETQSLNSFFTEKVNVGGTNSSLQKYGNNDFNQKSKPQLLSHVSTDAVPFSPHANYKTKPPRSAFTSTPLTTSTRNTSTNLNYKSPYGDSRNRSASITNPVANTYTPVTGSLFSKINEAPNRVNNISKTKTEDIENKVVINVTKSSKFYDDPKSKVPSYSTRSKRRGKLLLINNIKFANEQMVRKGAELDEKNIVELFTQIGFEIVKHRNLNKKDMENKIISFRNNSALKKFDIATVIVMSHGTGKESSGSTAVVCTDEQLIPTTWIINQFDGTLCPHLVQKPKIFIFQCCRGGNREGVVQHDSLPNPVPRSFSDMLIAYSTIPGFVSHREPQNGTWYINLICKVFSEHAHDTDVESLLKIVDHKLSSFVSHMGSKQTSSFENRGFKTCFLHPKLNQ